MNQENFCTKCGGVKTVRMSKESYTYDRNQPKNIENIVLKPMPNYIHENYGYKYAMSRPARHENLPTISEEKEWPGII